MFVCLVVSFRKYPSRIGLRQVALDNREKDINRLKL